MRILTTSPTTAMGKHCFLLPPSYLGANGEVVITEKYINETLQSQLKLTARDLLLDNEASIF